MRFCYLRLFFFRFFELHISLSKVVDHSFNLNVDFNPFLVSEEFFVFWFSRSIDRMISIIEHFFVFSVYSNDFHVREEFCSFG